MTPAQTSPAAGWAHPLAPCSVRFGCGQKHLPPPWRFSPASSPSVAPVGSLCLMTLRDGDGFGDRAGDRSGKRFPSQATQHSLTHGTRDGSQFQFCPPGVQPRLPAWVTMGAAGWGKPAQWGMVEDDSPQKVHRAPFSQGTSMGLLGWWVCAEGQWGAPRAGGTP